jgi:hypothetical protein
MLEEFVSDTFDIELGLKDAFDDTTQQPSRRILAALVCRRAMHFMQRASFIMLSS